MNVKDENSIKAIRIGTPEELETAPQFLALWAMLLHRYRGDTSTIFEFTVAPVTVPQMVEVAFDTDPNFATLMSNLRTRPIDVESRGPVRCSMPGDLVRALSDGSQSSAAILLDVPLVCFERRNDESEVTILDAAGHLNGKAISRFIRHCEVLFHAAFESPSCPVSQLRMMDDDELYEILAARNGSLTNFRRRTIPNVFQEQVCKVPHLTALRYGEKTLTYQELHEFALRVAGAAGAAGIGVETLVAVYLDDPVSTAIVYMGVVLAGGVLLPFDPEWPPDRLETVISEAKPQFMCTEAWRATENIGPDIRVLHYEDMMDWSLSSSPRDLDVVTPDNAAYVIFTSGSTGTPKGVVGLHRTVTSAGRHASALGENEVFALSANLAFGAGVLGLFGPLMLGAAVLLVSRSTTKDLSALVREWERAGVTRIVAVPPQIRQLSLLGLETFHRLRKIRGVFLTGAVLTLDLLLMVYDLFPQATISNGYSCLEVGTMTTKWVFRPEDRKADLTVGRVLPNIRVYILGPKLNPLPAGMAGEIYVGSADLSRGYLNRPELTRERFIPNPFKDLDIPRLYRTGDIGRFRPDGELEYLGRRDNQVKVRGIRVELEEIEVALQAKPEVHLTAVTAVPHGSESRLIAFVVFKPGFAVSMRALREYLKTSLPSYMVPTLFVLMRELPLTRNGKIDRQNLPDIGTDRPEIDTEYMAPRDDLEKFVTRIWEEELGINGIGMDDQFVEVGGDSLTAVRIAARMNNRFGCDISPNLMFDYGTVRAVAVHCREQAFGKMIPEARAFREERIREQDS